MASTLLSKKVANARKPPCTDMTLWRVQFADRLSALRKAQGWSQTRLAKELGIARGTVNDLEFARNTASRKTIQKLMDLEERLGDMFTNEEVAIELGWQYIPDTLPGVQWQNTDGRAGSWPPNFQEYLSETIACWDAMAYPMRWRLRKFADASGLGWCFENEIDNVRWVGRTSSEAIILAFMTERQAQEKAE